MKEDVKSGSDKNIDNNDFRDSILSTRLPMKNLSQSLILIFMISTISLECGKVLMSPRQSRTLDHQILPDKDITGYVFSIKPGKNRYKNI